MSRILLVLLVGMLFSCKEEATFVPRDIASVEIRPLLEDSLLSVRAIDVLEDQSIAFAANNGVYGIYNVGGKSFKTSVQLYDSLPLHFRSVGHTSKDFFMLSIESPALLFKTGSDGNMELVYKEEVNNPFYDSMNFWNDMEGIAIGDPTDGCMSIIITRDGGHSWGKIPCVDLPKAKKGEAAFAASDTNIVIIDDHTWVATGGKASRILYSPDKGKTWEVYNTPIVQGIETTGIYSIDFYDENIGFAIGGDYTKPEDNTANKIRTGDGGKTWELVAQNQNPGYRSCVQYIPNRMGKELIAVGFNGIDYSNDSGSTWKHISDEGFYTLRFLNDSVAVAAGAKRISKLIFRE